MTVPTRLGTRTRPSYGFRMGFERGLGARGVSFESIFQWACEYEGMSRVGSVSGACCWTVVPARC